MDVLKYLEPPGNIPSSGLMIYLFWSLSDTTISCFTIDPEGANLPDEFAPWEKNGGGEAIYTGALLDGCEEQNSIVLAVERDGLYVLQIGDTKHTLH
jgi:hypothetical protein